MEDPKEIAGRLEQAEKRALSEGYWAVWPMTTRLIGLGLVSRCSGRRFMVELTPLGLAVRETLLTPTREDQSYD